MSDIFETSARRLVERLSQRELSARDLCAAVIERIEAIDPEIHAWQHFDAELVRTQAKAVDASIHRGPLHGLPIGVKDLMDTGDMPATYGSPIYAGHRPTLDAAAVAASRSAGAIVIGKTVTTEFATFKPGPTVNPRSPEGKPHTPGGSSSGSAAAVAAGMVPVALGTQTAGSIIRPAAYCGVVGYKPTHGLLPLAGIKPLSPSLDTVGAIARSVDDAAFFVGALTRLSLAPQPIGRIRVGICRTPYWDRASADSRQALELASRELGRMGATVSDVLLPAEFSSLHQSHLDIMEFEAAAAFAPELRTASHQFSEAFAAVIAKGQTVTGERFFAAQAAAYHARMVLQNLMENVDVILAPSTEGVAPSGLHATGDPIFNRMWSLLGNPCVHVPVGTGDSGMPIGTTLVGRRYQDAQVIAAAHALELALK